MNYELRIMNLIREITYTNRYFPSDSKNKLVYLCVTLKNRKI